MASNVAFMYCYRRSIMYQNSPFHRFNLSHSRPCLFFVLVLLLFKCFWENCFASRLCKFKYKGYDPKHFWNDKVLFGFFFRVWLSVLWCIFVSLKKKKLSQTIQNIILRLNKENTFSLHQPSGLLAHGEIFIFCCSFIYSWLLSFLN